MRNPLGCILQLLAPLAGPGMCKSLTLPSFLPSLPTNQAYFQPLTREGEGGATFPDCQGESTWKAAMGQINNVFHTAARRCWGP